VKSHWTLKIDKAAPKGAAYCFESSAKDVVDVGIRCDYACFVRLRGHWVLGDVPIIVEKGGAALLALSR